MTNPDKDLNIEIRRQGIIQSSYGFCPPPPPAVLFCLEVGLALRERGKERVAH